MQATIPGNKRENNGKFYDTILIINNNSGRSLKVTGKKLTRSYNEVVSIPK